VEITHVEQIFVSKTRLYHITTKSEKNSGIFAKIAEIYGEIGGQISPRPGNSGELTSPGTNTNSFSANKGVGNHRKNIFVQRGSLSSWSWGSPLGVA
jgi:hypothetical protein